MVMQSAWLVQGSCHSHLDSAAKLAPGVSIVCGTLRVHRILILHHPFSTSLVQMTICRYGQQLRMHANLSLKC